MSFAGIAQEELHSKKKKAVAEYTQAKDLIALQQYNQAVAFLRSAIKRDKSFDEAILLLAQLYLQKGESTNALNLVSNGEDKLDTTFLNRAYFDLATFFWAKGSYQNASDYLARIDGEILNISTDQMNQLSASVNFSLTESERNGELVNETLVAQLNGFDMQYFPSIDASGTLVFTARDKRWGGDEQIMVTTDSTGFWKSPQLISSNINSELNEGTAAISADGLTLVFTGCNRSDSFGSCDLFISKKENNEWQKPELLPKEINTRYWESQPSLSSRGDLLYFVSTRPGFGGQDIWVSQNVAGKWLEAKNLGNNINTKDDDASPFIFPDDRTLFFSSKGGIGLGGFDVFKSEMALNDWSTPINLGGSVNDNNDQVGYSIGLDGMAYFSTADNIGKLRLQRIRLPEDLVPKVELKNLTVQVLDSINLKAVESSATLLVNNEEIALNAESEGYFKTIITELPVYVKINAGGYLPKKAKISSLNDSILMARKFVPITFAPIYYESNEFQLTQYEKDRLAMLVNDLDSSTEFKIRITGYTDSVGSVERNNDLAKSRVDKVRKFLLQLGVPENILISAINGEKDALMANGDQFASKDFRKVEVTILGLQ